ncbi:hypothetical protein GH714_037005 [Hevea brasiliensis]|uniref:Uncharacterized protein n=1 Tax=Hevea brasiliensis TaxID=3981 RepID=A0A6A6L4D0_HEVBR|nr:hypothetical protein GH714_037005 [Hevea brasiliensis]
MGLEGLQSLQNFHLLVPHSSSSCGKPVCPRSYSLSSFQNLSNLSFAYSLGRPSTPFGSCDNLRSSGLKRSCSAQSNEFFNEEFAKKVQDFARKLDVTDDKDNKYNDTASSAVSEISKHSTCKDGTKSREKTDRSISFLPSFLEPNFLGIQPEPPEWPERDEIAKMSIVIKANSVEIPLSLRMIGRKQKWQEGFVDAGEFAYCSVKKAFFSMVFIIRELQNYALSIRGRLYSEDLQAVVNKFQKEMNASFVWIFQQVFSRAPNLMVYVMLLLVNFTVHSMTGNMAASPSRRLYDKLISTQETSLEQISGERLSTSLPDISFPGYEKIIEEEEIELWNLVVEEAAIMQEESSYPVLDQETMKHLLSPISVEIEPDDYVEFHRTDLVYQMSVAEDPNNPLLLSNYAQFLYLVRHDYDRAEECFKRAIMSGPPDPETFSCYADFLWLVRKDLWNAEEVYQQAMEAAPNSHYYASKDDYCKYELLIPLLPPSV